MVDALVLEASTSVCGFESHLPHQKKKGTERCLFLLVPAAAGTSASLHLWQEPAVPPHAPSLFVIPYSLQSKRTAPATGRGLEPNGAPGFFLCPKFAPPPAKSKLTALPTGFPKTALPESVPQSGTPQLFTFPYSLFTCPAPAFPSHSLGAPASCSQQGRRISSPAAMRDCKTPFPRTAPPAGHRLVLNPCRRAAHQSSSLFSILSSLAQPCLFFPPGRTAKQKYILFFGHLTHNSARYNIGLNLIMEGKEYGKTGSA